MSNDLFYAAQASGCGVGGWSLVGRWVGGWWVGEWVAEWLGG